MAVSYVHIIDTQLVGQEFKRNTKKFNIINENEDKFKSIKMIHFIKVISMREKHIKEGQK